MRILKGWEFLLRLRGCRLVWHVVAENQCLIWDPAFAAVSMHTGWYLLPVYYLLPSILRLFLFSISTYMKTLKVKLNILLTDQESKYANRHMYATAKARRVQKRAFFQLRSLGETLSKGNHLVSISNFR